MHDRTESQSEETLGGAEGDEERAVTGSAHRSSEESIAESTGEERETLAGDVESGGP